MKLKETIAVFVGLMVSATSHAATLIVTNTLDSGAGSLRQAVADSNIAGGTNTIAFNIPGGGVHTIYVDNTMPNFTTPTTLDGFTQPGSSSNTLATGNNAVLLIEVTTTNNSQGFVTQAEGCLIRGIVINGFNQGLTFGIGGPSSAIEGCFIGTDATGTNASPRATPVGIYCPFGNNRIGGANPWQRNVISGCSDVGVETFNAVSTNNWIVGNYIGTDKTGTKAIANGVGILIESPANQIISNLVSGNLGEGIQILYSNTLVQANIIGAAANATNALGNNFGISVCGGCGSNQIGTGNVISGNRNTGILIGGDNNLVQGNHIGTDSAGTQAVPNENGGIDLNSGTPTGNHVTGNLISGNTGYGLSFFGATNNLADGNIIGADVTGTSALGNSGDGVLVNGTANSIIDNLIAFNGSSGISVPDSLAFTNNAFSINSIFGNGVLGIDLVGNDLPSGVTTNDTCDTDNGANHLQNFPVITSSTSDVNVVTIAGFLPGAPSTTFRLEFFANATCDPSGFGDGESFIGSTNVTTGANCTSNFTVTLPVAVPNAYLITATATDPAGNTSEFSACRTNFSAVVTASCTLVPQLGTNTVGTTHEVTATVTTNGAPAVGASVAFSVSGANAVAATNVTANGSGQASFAYVGNSTGTDTIRAIATVSTLSSTCTASKVWIEVVTNTPPTITCPADISTNTAQGQCARSVAFTVNASGSPTPAVTCTTNGAAVSSPVTFPVGTTTVDCIASNAVGSMSCSFDVTVNDTEPPTITCPGTITSNVAAGVTGSVVDFTVTATDNCGVASTNCSPPSGSTFDLGTTPVICAAVDPAGNTNTCTFNVVVSESAPEVHDLAVIRMKAPKNINLKGAEASLTQRVVVQIQNRSPHHETITNLAELVQVTLTNGKDSEGCAPEARLIDGPPNQPGRVLKPKQKMNIFFEVTFTGACVPDPMKGAGHEDFSYRAVVHHAALDGNPDTHTADDDCPRAALPGGVDPNPDPNKPLKDKGCTAATTDVFVK
jgi:hypothetical protein